MRIDWRIGGLWLVLVTIVPGCGSYSAPSNPSAPDSAGDSMSAPGYSHRPVCNGGTMMPS
jgi:hypothetical protein